MKTNQFFWNTRSTDQELSSLKIFESSSDEPILQFFTTMGGKYAPLISRAPETFQLLEKAKLRLKLMPNINKDLIDQIETLQRSILNPW
jgi:hypothetical protein